MLRPVLAFVICTILAGCQSQSGNPFMRTTVPPPATGAGSPTDPYYNNTGNGTPAAAAAGPSAVPASTPKAPVVPPPEKRFTTPGGINLPLGSVNHHKAVEPSAGELRASPTALARTLAKPKPDTASEESVTLASAEQADDLVEAAINEDAVETDGEDDDSVTQPTRIAASEPIKPASSNEPEIPEFADEANHDEEAELATHVQAVDPQPNALGTLRFASASEPAVDTSDDPNISNQTASNQVDGAATAIASTGGLRVAADSEPETSPSDATSVTEPVGSPRFYYDRHRGGAAESRLSGRRGTSNNQAHGTEGEPASAGSTNYAYHADYQWLKGKLEYSPASRRWKLRYIPLDGNTDGFGGSVILGNPPQLTGFNPGDWVLVRGQVTADPADAGGFSPPYELASVERVAK
jgi:hypothetical protein